MKFLLVYSHYQSKHLTVPYLSYLQIFVHLLDFNYINYTPNKAISVHIDVSRDIMLSRDNIEETALLYPLM